MNWTWPPLLRVTHVKVYISFCCYPLNHELSGLIMLHLMQLVINNNVKRQMFIWIENCVEQWKIQVPLCHVWILLEKNIVFLSFLYEGGYISYIFQSIFFFYFNDDRIQRLVVFLQVLKLSSPNNTGQLKLLWKLKLNPHNLS